MALADFKIGARPASAIIGVGHNDPQEGVSFKQAAVVEFISDIITNPTVTGLKNPTASQIVSKAIEIANEMMEQME